MTFFKSNKRLQVSLVVILVTLTLAGGCMAYLRGFLPLFPYPEVQKLASVSWNFDSYKEYFVNLAKNKGAPYAFTVLMRSHIPFGTNVHSLGHSIGYVLYDQKGLAGLSDCTHDLEDACFHAVITEEFVLNGSKALTNIAEYCVSKSPESANFRSCFHGAGHGLLAQLDYDLTGAVGMCKKINDIARSLNPRITSELAWDECVGGALMELGRGNHDPAASERARLVYMPDSDPLMPCDAAFMPMEVRPMCYANIRPRFFNAAGMTAQDLIPSPSVIRKAFSFCGKIPVQEARSRDQCYGGFGYSFVNFVGGYDTRSFPDLTDQQLKDVHAWCALAGDYEDQIDCMLVATDTIFDDGHVESPASFAFCRLAPDSVIQENCYQRLIDLAKQNMESNRRVKEICPHIPDPYRNSCMPLGLNFSEREFA